MEKHEQAPQELEKSWLQIRAREVALFLALGAGSQFLHDQRVEGPKEECKIHNKEELGKKFSIEIVKGNENGDVAYFIGQMHGMGDLPSMNAMPVIKKVVADSQRVTGEALALLEAEEAFVEGITEESEAYFAAGSKEITQLRGLMSSGAIDEALLLIAKRVDRFRENIEARKLSDYKIAFEELYLLARLDEVFLNTKKGELKAKNKTLLDTLLKTRETLRQAPHLVDGGYEWGAVYVLWAQGKIRIRACEELGLYLENLKLNEKMSQYYKLHGAYSEEDARALKEIAAKREDAALRFAFRDRKKPGEDRRVIIYGVAHDFFENFNRFDTSGQVQGFGFAQLQDKKQEEYDREIEAAHHMIEGPSTKDDRETR